MCCHDLTWLSCFDLIFYVKQNRLISCEGHFYRILNEDEDYLGVVRALQTFRCKMKKIIFGLVFLPFLATSKNQILEENLVTLQSDEKLSTVRLKNCEISSKENTDLSLNNKVTSGNLLTLVVAGKQYTVESFGLFARNDGQCLLSMKNLILEDN